MRRTGGAACALMCVPLLGGCGSGADDASGDDASGDDAGDTDGDGSGSDDDGSGSAVDLGAPEPLCDPTGGGPHWLLETETVQAQIGCATGLALDGSAFTIDPLPSGAAYDPVTATFTWTPGLDQGAVYELTIKESTYGEEGILKIGVADAWEDPDNVPVVDPLAYTEEYALPVVHMQTSPLINPDAYEPATIIYMGHVYTAESKLRGAVSLDYPKNNYTMKFSEDDRFNDPEHDFLNKRKVVLITPFDDNSYIRQRLGYELWNRLDPEHIQVQVYNGVLFLDGEYWGLYTISDHVDRFLMAQHGLTEAGDLFKARNHDANFRLTDYYGGPKDTLHDGYTKSEGFPLDGQPGAFDDLHELVDFVATASSEEFLAEVDQRIDRRDYENWWIWASFTESDDSAGKNSYHHHLPTGGQFRVVPWDLNQSSGQDWQTFRVPHDEDMEERYTYLNELFTRFLSELSIGPALRERYAVVLGEQYEIRRILDRVDEMIDEIDASARRDERRWGDEYASYWGARDDLIPYEQEVEYLRQWIGERWAYARSVYP